MFSSFLIAFLFLIGYVSLHISDHKANYKLFLDYLKNNSTLWFAFLFNVFASSLVGFLIDFYLEKYIFPSLIDLFARKNKGLDNL